MHLAEIQRSFPNPFQKVPTCLQINMYPVLVAEESISKEVMFHLILKRQTEARMQFEAFDSQQQTRLKRVRLAVM